MNNKTIKNLLNDLDIDKVRLTTKAGSPFDRDFSIRGECHEPLSYPTVDAGILDKPDIAEQISEGEPYYIISKFKVYSFNIEEIERYLDRISEFINIKYYSIYESKDYDYNKCSVVKIAVGNELENETYHFTKFKFFVIRLLVKDGKSKELVKQFLELDSKFNFCPFISLQLAAKGCGSCNIFLGDFIEDVVYNYKNNKDKKISLFRTTKVLDDIYCNDSYASTEFAKSKFQKVTIEDYNLVKEIKKQLVNRVYKSDFENNVNYLLNKQKTDS